MLILLNDCCFDPDARAHDYFEGGPDPTMFERFRQNIIQTLYKALTQFEIFVRQPNYQNLTASDESELYKRRVILNAI
jgi:hypothetical protein